MANRTPNQLHASNYIEDASAKRVKILARHKWVAGCVITESIVNEAQNIRRFTATIRGWRNWKVFEGRPDGSTVVRVIAAVTGIRNKIDSGDESVFTQGSKLPLVQNSP